MISHFLLAEEDMVFDGNVYGDRPAMDTAAELQPAVSVPPRQGVLYYPDLHELKLVAW